MFSFSRTSSTINSWQKSPANVTRTNILWGLDHVHICVCGQKVEVDYILSAATCICLSMYDLICALSRIVWWKVETDQLFFLLCLRQQKQNVCNKVFIWFTQLYSPSMNEVKKIIDNLQPLRCVYQVPVGLCCPGILFVRDAATCELHVFLLDREVDIQTCIFWTKNNRGP